MTVYKRYNDISIQCRICEHFLQDEVFVKEFNTKFVCDFDDDIDADLMGVSCEEFKVGKWHLVEFLKFHMETYHNKIWCTKCDVVLENKGVALDCPEDGIFYECPTCNYRIVILKKGV